MKRSTKTATPDEQRKRRVRERATIYRAIRVALQFVRGLEPVGAGQYHGAVGSRAAVLEALLPAEQWVVENWSGLEDEGEDTHG